jgi:hypothetical protein
VRTRISGTPSRRKAGALERQPWLRDDLADAGLHDLAAAFEHADEELVFALEVVMDRAFAQARAVGDVLHARRGDALFGEHSDGRVENLLTARVALLVGAPF